MGEDLSLGFKIAAGAVIMAFILSIGLSLMLLGRNLWNTTASAIMQPVSAIVDTDAFYLASYNKPIPVADIWKLVKRINYGVVADNGNGNITVFSIKEQSPTNPSEWILVSTAVAELDTHMAKKAYMSWQQDDVTGMYTMEVLLVS